MNGKILESMNLPRQFNSIEEFSLIIRYFSRRNFRTGFHREDENVIIKQKNYHPTSVLTKNDIGQITVGSGHLIKIYAAHVGVSFIKFRKGRKNHRRK